MGLFGGGRRSQPQGVINSLFGEINLMHESIEQTWVGSAAVYPVGTVTVNTETVFGSGVVCDPGRLILVNRIELTADGPCRIEVVKDATYTSGWMTWGVGSADYPFNKNMFKTFGPNGGTADFSFDIPFLMTESSSLQFKYYSKDTSTKWCSYVVHGVDITADPYYQAKKKIVVIGDSLAHGIMGLDSNGRSFLGESLWSFRLVEQLRKDGVDCRLINMGENGMRAMDMYYALKNGQYNSLLDYDLLIVLAGANDATVATAIPEAKFKEAIGGFIQPNKRIDKKPVLFLGMPVMDASERAANIPTYRQYVKDVAQDSTLGGVLNRVYYHDLTTGYGLNATAASDLNFRDAERITGSRLHQSGVGHALNFMHTNGDADNGILPGAVGGIYGVVKKYKLI